MDSELEHQQHYSRKPRRKAEFIAPSNDLRQKVGYGGLSDEIIDKAQSILENNTTDFSSLADVYLNALMDGIQKARGIKLTDDPENVIVSMLYPAMQLKANGGMFHYPLVTVIADRLIQFLEVIEYPDIETVEIVLAFHTTIRAIVSEEITSDGGERGSELKNALIEACSRYFDKHPENISVQDTIPYQN